jgi:putative hydrolase of the HAD superfamily
MKSSRYDMRTIASGLGRYLMFIFDFDNTIYDERDYLFSQYGRIAADICGKFELDENAVRSWMVAQFSVSGRSGLFQRLFETFGIPSSYLPAALKILRESRPVAPLIPFPDVAGCIRAFVERAHVVILTNGNKTQQQNKIAHLADDVLRSLPAYFADDYKPKPSPEAAIAILRDFGVLPQHAVLIGDSDTDKQCAIGAEIDFLNIEALRQQLAGIPTPSQSWSRNE